MRRLILLGFTAALLFAAQASAQTVITTRNVVTGLDTPWEILWGPDDWIWMTERYGRVSRVNPEDGEIDVLTTIPDVSEQSESGLLGMAFHPGFPDSPYVYVVYTYREDTDIHEKLVRYTYADDTLDQPLVLLDNIQGNTTHDGSRLLVTPDGKLLMTTGDAQNQSAAQSLNSLSGKILRMNPDGTTPADNPHTDLEWPYSLIWTLGHRNPQGLVMVGSKLFSSEHGPSNDDEVNVIMKGRNYGWPQVHGYCNEPNEQTFCTDSNVVEPIQAWTPTLAVCGLDFYNNPRIPEWQNSLLMVTLKEQDLRRLRLNNDRTAIIEQKIEFNGTYGRLRDLCISPDGRVFIATSNRDGRGVPSENDDRIIEIKGSMPEEQSISTGEITGSPFCPGAAVMVPFTITGTFDGGNVFSAELSDANGAFDAPVVIGTLPDVDEGTIAATLPSDLPPGQGYRIRVVADNPAETGSDNGEDLTLLSLPEPEIEATSVAVCAGEEVTLDAGDGFQEYLWSNGATTRQITVAVEESGSYYVTVENSGGCSGSDTVMLTALQKPAPEIRTVDEAITDICEGDSVILETVQEYASYNWSNGAVTRRITVRDAGDYSVEVTNESECVGSSEATTVTVRPRPSKPTIDWDGTILTSSDAGGFQWYLNGEPIPNANDRTYTPLESGRYRVEIVGFTGCSALSDPIDITISSGVAVVQGADEALDLYPQPVHENLLVRLRLQRPADVDLQLVDVRGAEVLRLDDRAADGSFERTLSLTGLPSGTYLLSITADGRRWTRTVIKGEE